MSEEMPQARVIRGTLVSPGNTTSSSGARVIDGAVFDARAEAKRIGEEARARARKEVAEAESVAASIREQARAEGYEAGLAELNETALRFREERERKFEEHKSEMVSLAVRVAGKILGREIEDRPETFTDLVIRAIRGIRHEKRIQIRVHPSDLDRARDGLERLRTEVGPGKEIEVREDRSVVGGGCVVETDLGIIDARLDTQLKVLEKALLRGK